MNILFVSQAAWDNRNSVGNTVSNWFENWEDDIFFHFYTRKRIPDNNVVTEYYNLSATDILKGLKIGKIKGNRFSDGDIDKIKVMYKTEAESEQKLAKNIKNSKMNELFFGVSELLWVSGLWINDEFKRFVKELQPDILFAFATNEYILKPIIRYLNHAFPSCKVILYVADDVYEQANNMFFIRKEISRSLLKYCISKSQRLYGASNEICKKYASIYKVEIAPLYKGCRFNYSIKSSVNHPLRFVYAGNLLFGRYEVLKQIISAFERMNFNGNKVVLEIYSSSPIDDMKRKTLNVEGSSIYIGSKPYEEIKMILAEADVVLEVESFDRQYSESVKYSFSTKVIDCLQSGSAILAIGPAGQSAIEYIRAVPGSFVVDKIEQLDSVINLIVEDAKTLPERAETIRRFALEHHELNSVRNKLRCDFRKTIDNSDQ